MTTALLLKIGADASALRGELNVAKSAMNNFTGQMKQLGGVIAGAFAIDAVAGFAMECSKLAAEAEGVSSAFKKIPGSTVLLNQMRVATENTVSDLELMKLGVEGLNNRVPLENMAEILNFIDRTADSTGASFNELASTIIKNIGKESTKGLNELGLSIETVKTNAESMGFMPALLEEIRRKSQELGEVSAEAGDANDRWAASVNNLKAAWGTFLNSKVMTGLANTVADSLDLISGNLNMTKEQINKVLVAFNKLREEAKQAGDTEGVKRWTLEIAKLTAKYGLLKDKAVETSTTVTPIIENEAFLVEKLNDKKAESLQLVGASRAAINQEIRALEEKIKKLRELGVAQKTVDTPTRKPLDVNKPLTPQPINATGTLVDPAALNAQIKTSLEGLKNVTLQTTPQITGAFLEMSNEVQSAMAGMATGLGTAIGDMMLGVGGLELIAATVVSGLGSMATQLGQTMIQFGIAGLALKKFVKSPAAAIAAGIALVALGRVLSAKAQGIAGGGRSGSGGGASGGSGLSDRSRNSLSGNTQDIALTGEVKINNNDLVVALSNANNRNKYTKS
ncbi:MAG: hypothetical protein WAZ98_03870 [Cyclobacteriaceae bacterium]